MISMEFEDSVAMEQEIIYGSDHNFLYHVLGLPHTATDAEIKRAYRKCALMYHPDKQTSGMKPEKRKQSDLKFKQINQAYHILSKPRYRRLYDEFNGNTDVPNVTSSSVTSCAQPPRDFVRYIFSSIVGSKSKDDQEQATKILNVKVAAVVCTICLFGYFLLLALGLILVTVRLDGGDRSGLTSVAWVVIFIPFWILWMIAVVLSVLMAHRVTQIKLQQMNEKNRFTAGGKLEQGLLGGEQSEPFFKITGWSFLNVPVMTVTLFLSHLLVAISLDINVSTSTWKYLVLPYLLAECFCFMTSFRNNMNPQTVKMRIYGVDAQNILNVYDWRVFVTSTHFFLSFCLRICIVLIILANLYGELTTWYSLLVPSCIYGVSQVLSVCAKYPPGEGNITMISVFTLYLIVFRFLPALMLMAKLQLERGSTATRTSFVNSTENVTDHFDLPNITLFKELVERHYVPLSWCLSFVWVELGVILLSLLASCCALWRLMREDCTYISLNNAEEDEFETA